MADLDKCPECDRGESESMVECTYCFQWFHYECVHLSQLLVDKIIDYYCQKCESQDGMLTSWKKVRPSASKSNEKRRFYFEVEEIVAHRTRRVGFIQSRMFRVKWKNYSVALNSWEPEHHLDGCIDILQKYLRENNLPYSNIDGLLGASDSNSSAFDERNWTSMSDVVSIFRTFQERYFPKSDLPFENWTEFGESDKLYFVRYQSHCFVVLYYAGSRIGHVADGWN